MKVITMTRLTREMINKEKIVRDRYFQRLAVNINLI